MKSLLITTALLSLCSLTAFAQEQAIMRTTSAQAGNVCYSISGGQNGTVTSCVNKTGIKESSTRELGSVNVGQSEEYYDVEFDTMCTVSLQNAVAYISCF